ncbi:MAG: U32 family peptidase [Deltaproteobacteria bacterium]|nr:U32 family peptidase [Deltaproteobacteria bacterium]
MRILAPIRAPEEVEVLCRAGADEFYCGLTPRFWAERYGSEWVHRRDPRAAGLRDEEALVRVKERAGGRPVYVTLNAPHYPEEAVMPLVAFGRHLVEDLGVDGLIVAETELLLALVEEGLACRVHVSSLATCTNPGAAAFYRDLGVARIVLPRHLTPDEIGEIGRIGVEVEAFVLNDGCVFEEGLCATTHSLGPFCLADGPGTEGLGEAVLEGYEFWKWTLNNCGCRTNRGYPLGPCGLCALPRFREMGISSLKVVGREASLDRKRASVELTALAVGLVRAGAGPRQIREAVVARRGGRSLCQGAHLCYYPQVWTGVEEAVAC